MPAVIPHAVSESLVKKHGIGCGSKATHMGKVPATVQTGSKVNKLDQQQQSDLTASVNLCHAEVMPGLHNMLNACGQSQVNFL